MCIAANYTDRETVNGYTLAKAKNGLHYIFDKDGNVCLEVAFTTRERAIAYVPKIDHMTRFGSTFQSR